MDRDVGSGRGLVLIDRARKALAEAKTIGDVVEIRDQAVALKHYAAKKRGAEEAEGYANELAIRAERKIGTITLALETEPGKRTDKPCPPGGQGSTTKEEALADAGVSRQRASEYERLATVPQSTFEREVTKPDASTKAIVKLAPPRRTRSFKATKRVLPQGEDPRADWCEEVAKAAQAEARRFKNDPFNKGIIEIGRRASVLAKAIRSAAKSKGS